MNNQSSSETVIGLPKKKSGFPFLRKKRLVILFILILVVGFVSLSYFMLRSRQSLNEDKINNEISDVNRALQANEPAQALEHSKKALALNPNDLYTLEMTASLTKESDPEEAKRLYARALEVFKKNDNPDTDGKKSITYMAAGGLAENAGLLDQAKHYYQKAINSSDPNDPNNRAIMIDAEERLKKLQ